MGSRKKKKRDRKKRPRPLRPRPPRLDLPGGDILLVEPPGERKMSEVLLEFVEPYADQWRTVEELKKLLSVAVIAWNAALLSGRERDGFIRKMVEAVPPEARPDMRAILEEMVRHKVAHFANVRRTILDFQVSMTPTGPHVSVISTLESL